MLCVCVCMSVCVRACACACVCVCVCVCARAHAWCPTVLPVLVNVMTGGSFLSLSVAIQRWVDPILHELYIRTYLSYVHEWKVCTCMKDLWCVEDL